LVFVFMQVILGMIAASCVQTACLMASNIWTAVPPHWVSIWSIACVLSRSSSGLQYIILLELKHMKLSTLKEMHKSEQEH